MKLKRILSIFLVSASMLAIVGCSNNNSDDTTASGVTPTTTPGVTTSTTTTTVVEGDEVYPTISKDTADFDGFSFSGLQVDTTNAKTIYYVGEEFSSEGLVVTAYYRKMVDGSWQRKNKEITTYSINTDAFDSSVIGAQDIIISYREGDINQSVTYTVNIFTSPFARMTSGSYVAGLNVTFKDGGLKENNTYLREQYVDTAFTATRDSFNFEKIVNTINADGYITQTTETLASRSIKNDSITSNIDITKIGTYTIKIEYDAGNVTIDGEEFENKITTFALLNVINPVKSISKASTNDTTFEATPRGIDLSVWKFNITRNSGLVEEVNYSSDLFRVSGIKPLITGNYEATVEYLGSYLGNSRPSVKVNVTIAESSKYNIKIYTDLSEVMVDNAHVSVGTITETTTGVDLTNGDGIIVGDNLKQGSKNASYDGLTFNYKITVQAVSKSSKLVFKLDNPGVVVIYLSSTSGSDLVRSFIIKDENGDDFFEGETSVFNVPEDRFELTFEKAGTYTLTVPSGGIYYFGAVVALEK